MRPGYTPRFLRNYAQAPRHIQRAFGRKLELLLKNLRHPSLRAKKYNEAQNIWQARVEESFLEIYNVGHRRDVYETLRRLLSSSS